MLSVDNHKNPYQGHRSINTEYSREKSSDFTIIMDQNNVSLTRTSLIASDLILRRCWAGRDPARSLADVSITQTNLSIKRLCTVRAH